MSARWEESISLVFFVEVVWLNTKCLVFSRCIKMQPEQVDLNIDIAVGDYSADEQTLEWQRWRECKKKKDDEEKKRLFVLNLVVGKSEIADPK